MKKLFLSLSLVCGLAVVPTSEVQGGEDMLLLAAATSLVAGATWLSSGALFGPQAALHDWQEMEEKERVMIRAGLLILPINIISFICMMSGYAFPIFIYVFGVTLIALIGLTVGNIVFNIGKQIFNVVSGKRTLSKRKQRKRARHRKKRKLVIAATV